MTALKGILVRLKTKKESGAGTDDHIYIGIVGSGGGGEFPLDVIGFKNFQEGSKVKYWFGDVWEGIALKEAKNPFQANRWNNPSYRHIDLDKVDYVYLRKHSHKGGIDDDAWKMESVQVTLYGPKPKKRTYYLRGDLWLANEYGLQVWLEEKTDLKKIGQRKRKGKAKAKGKRK
ncbi:MAG: hypothetical protein JSV56_02735 [Methanomassiliicoccales archaeon]|nr:MAG: hypothetical protein JSV56_02735 [Methanomassiliicoccales archaeon]